MHFPLQFVIIFQENIALISLLEYSSCPLTRDRFLSLLCSSTHNCYHIPFFFFLHFSTFVPLPPSISISSSTFISRSIYSPSYISTPFFIFTISSFTSFSISTPPFLYLQFPPPPLLLSLAPLSLSSISTYSSISFFDFQSFLNLDPFFYLCFFIHLHLFFTSKFSSISTPFPSFFFSTLNRSHFFFASFYNQFCWISSPQFFQLNIILSLLIH
ncbi:unnamed protein product [Acanthosepion pharaonis]|uniref:Uncharacterized protein n=1 Tax=Acanthosepion pharaonis TaxID=158019 RepID=A0A812EF89_ACAPH|nr:unnamed protein product [Sepia pharaonis]